MTFPKRAPLPPLLALAAFVAVCCQLDPGGADPGMPEGPGLTVDEGFSTQQGAYLTLAARQYGIALIDPRSLGEIFDPANSYLPDHPPLGRLWLGVWHDLAWAVHAPESPGGPFSVARARVGSAAAFALTVFLIAACGSRWFGAPAGLAAGASLILMPRVWGHAHIASLETVTNLFFTLCLCGAAAWWDPRVVNYRRPAMCGVLLGLALLCKVQGALLVPAVAVWAAYHAGRTHGWKSAWRAGGPVAAFGGVGAVVFFVGWPYFWVDLWNNPATFLATIVDRAPVRNFYLGLVWNADRSGPTPWHYPPVMTLATVPVGLTALAFLGALGGGRREAGGVGEGQLDAALPSLGRAVPRPPDTRVSLFGFAVLVPLAVCCTRGNSLYDGVRLFLVIFPPLALLAGRGTGLLYDRAKMRRPRLAAVAVIGLLAAQGANVVWMSPVWLSSYSAAVGGLWGADRLGFERNYWGDAVTRELLNTADMALPPGVPIRVVPTLHQFQERDLAAASPFAASRWRAWRDEIAVMIHDGALDRPLPEEIVFWGVRPGVPLGPVSEEDMVEIYRADTLGTLLSYQSPAAVGVLTALPEDPLDPALVSAVWDLRNAAGTAGVPAPPPDVRTVFFFRQAALHPNGPSNWEASGGAAVVSRFGVPLAVFSTAPLDAAFTDTGG